MFAVIILVSFGILSAVQGSDEWQFQIRKPAVKAQQEKVAAEPGQPPASSGDQEESYYLVMYSATWCGPCQNWKRNELPKLKAAGVPVTIVDCDKDPQWNKARRAVDSKTGKTVVIPGVSAYPTFAVVRKSDRFPVASFVGPVSARQILEKIPKKADPPAAPAPPETLSMKWNIQGDWTPTVQQTASHMMEDHGIFVDGMTHQQMLSMHDLIHDLAGK